MKLEKWALIAEIIGAFAIVVSLVFVGTEVQRSRMAQVQAGTQAVVSEFNSAVRSLAEDPELACIYVVGMQDYSSLRGSQRARFSAYHTGVNYAYQQMHSLFLQGAIDADTWTGVDRLVTDSAGVRGWRQWLSTREQWFGDVFRDYLDSKLESENSDNLVFYDDPQCSDLLGL